MNELLKDPLTKCSQAKAMRTSLERMTWAIKFPFRSNTKRTRKIFLINKHPSPEIECQFCFSSQVYNRMINPVQQSRLPTYWGKAVLTLFIHTQGEQWVKQHRHTVIKNQEKIQHKIRKTRTSVKFRDQQLLSIEAQAAIHLWSVIVWINSGLAGSKYTVAVVHSGFHRSWCIKTRFVVFDIFRHPCIHSSLSMRLSVCTCRLYGQTDISRKRDVK